jgi:hypothetical protein
MVGCCLTTSSVNPACYNPNLSLHEDVSTSWIDRSHKTWRVSVRLDREKEAPNRARPVTDYSQARQVRRWVCLPCKFSGIYFITTCIYLPTSSSLTKSSTPRRQRPLNQSGNSTPRKGATTLAASVPQAQSTDRAVHWPIEIPSLLLDGRHFVPLRRSLGRRC